MLPSPLGVKSHPLFPLFYLRDLFSKKKAEVNYDHYEEIFPEGEGADVKAERTRTYAGIHVFRQFYLLYLKKISFPLIISFISYENIFSVNNVFYIL